MAPPCPILARYRLVAPGPCACFPFKFVQEFAYCSCVCHNLETLRLRFLAFHAGFLWFFAPFRSWASYDNGLYISLAHFWFSSLPATLNCYSCRNDLILLDPFLGQPFIPFLSGLSWALFCFYLWAPMSLWASTARLLSLGFLGLFANSILPWAFY